MLKRFLNYLKRLGKSNKDNNIQYDGIINTFPKKNDETIILPENQNKISVEENKIEKSTTNEKKIIEELDETTKQKKQVFDKIKKWDVIWSKRQEGRFDTEHKVGHDEGPFIVIDRDDNTLYCIEGSGTRPKESIWKCRYFKSDEPKYKLKKDTYYHVDWIYTIELKDFYYYLDHLNKEDKLEITKKIEIIKNREFENNYEIMPNQLDTLSLEVGDVFNLEEGRYLIINEQDNSYLITKIEENKKQYRTSKYIDVDCFNLQETHLIEKSTPNIHRTDLINNNLLQYVLKNYKKHLEFIRNKHSIERGTIIEHENNYYLIIGEEGQSWLTNQITSDCKGELIINDTKYNTNFKNIKIEKKASITPIDKATNKEMDNYKKIKENNKKNRKNENKNKPKKQKIRIGALIKDLTFDRQAHIVVEVEGDSLYAISLDALKNGTFLMNYYNKNEFTTTGINYSKKALEYMELIKEQYQYNEYFNVSYAALYHHEGVRNTKVGNTIKKNQDLFYIYGENEDSWKVYKIYKKRINDFLEVKIEKNKYYLDSTPYTLSKSNLYENMNTAYPHEIEYIAKRKPMKLVYKP